MLRETTLARIDALASRYPQRHSALAPALMLAQEDTGGFLAKEDVAAVAQALGVSLAAAYAVVTYYSLFNKFQVGKHHLRVDAGIPARLAGAEDILAHLRSRLGVEEEEISADGLFTYSRVEDLASGGSAPSILVHGRYYENLTPERVDELLESLKNGILPEWPTTLHAGGRRDILLRRVDIPGAARLPTARLHGAYQKLEKALAMHPEAIIREVKDSMLRGRGGAGFPTGIKWGYVAKDSGKPVYLICNADEGEPGTFKDRIILESDPHLLLEGMAIAARALGARKAFIYIRGEFEWLAQGLERAIDEARTAGLLCTEAARPGFEPRPEADLDIIVHRGSGSYLCGEETALIESLEGRRGQPRLRPPYPVASGLYGCPTVVHNVETFCCLPYIVGSGAQAFRSMGCHLSYGPKLFSVCGHIARPGVYEFPLGTPLTEVLAEAGGLTGRPKAFIVGGLSSPILTASEAQDLRLDFVDCERHGTALGSGSIIALDDSVAMPELALEALTFYSAESCGQCTVCREGSGLLGSILRRIVEGRGSHHDLALLPKLCATMDGATLCPLGTSFARVVGTIYSKFTKEFSDRIGTAFTTD